MSKEESWNLDFGHVMCNDKYRLLRHNAG